jgi:energy-coupling factor transporter transmembrane protein EcfT
MIISFYLSVVLVLIIIICLFIFKKWRNILWLLLIVLLIILGYLFFINQFASAVKEKCELHREWNIDNYYIIEKQCIGFSGPNYFPVYLYQNGKEIGQSFIDDSSCVVQFVNQKGDTIEFDICERIIRRQGR